MRALLSYLTLLFFAPLALAQAPAPLPPGVQALATVEGVSEYRLPNGLQVLLVPDDSKPTTTVNVTYRVGSRNENYGETGMAHLLEHLIFKGTPTTQRLLGEFSRRGLRANGSTWLDRTNYFASFSANEENLRWYLSWQADAMVNSLIARSDLDTEMTVVRNEMESGENNPNRVLLQKTMAAMYQWHNYGKSTIGARADVENVDIGRLQAFYRRFYQPDNATLIVAGKFDTARVLAWTAEFFGRIPKPQRTLAPTYTLDPVQDGERAVTLRRVGGAPLMYAAYHVPAGSHADFAAVEALSMILGNAPSGRLHKRLVEKQLAASTSGFAFGLAEPGALFFGAQLGPNQDVERARGEMLATIEGLAREPVTTQELERARVQWLRDWDQGFADPEQVGVALSEVIALGDWRLYFLQRDRMRALSLAEVQRVAEQRLLQSNRTLATYLPTERPQRAPAPEKVDVAAMVAGYKGDPAAKVAEAFDPTPAHLDARTERFALPSGLKAAVLAKGTRGGIVNARLRLQYGDEKSLVGQETAAAFTAAMLDKGGAGLGRQEIRDEFDRLRADVRFSASGQTLNVAVTTTRDNLPPVMALVSRLLREPAFPPEVLDEIKRQALAGIERSRKEPSAPLDNALDRLGNPYPRGDLRHARTFDEQVADVQAVNVEALRNFHRRFYSASTGEFGAAGDMDVAAVRQALEKGLGDWRAPAAGPMPYVRIPRPLYPVPAERLLIATPDKQNANMRVLLHLPLADTDADYPALLMANWLFGSGGSSRLWQRIREREGLSYDVRSFIAWNPWEPNSLWQSTAIFAPQNQPKVEAALREEVERALKQGFTQKELDEGRAGLLNYRRLSRAQDDNLSAELASNLRLGRDFGHAQRIDDALSRLTLAQVNAALVAHLKPGRFAMGFAGDFKAAP